MVDKEIIGAYRKIKDLGFSKAEAYKIFRENISCIDYLCENYFYLNRALDKVSKKELEKKYLRSKLSKQVREERHNLIFDAFEDNSYHFL